MFSVILHLNSLRFVGPAAVMMGASPAYVAMFAGWGAVSYVLPTTWRFAINDIIWETYQKLVQFFFENYTGAEVILYGDVESLKTCENAIYICNHQSTMDWVVANMMAIRAGMLGHTRFILKDGLKYMPQYGYSFGQHGCIYVKRAKKFDSVNARRFKGKLDLLRKKDIPTWMVIFPEGTRYNPSNPDVIRASQDFETKNGLDLTHHVLSPRVKAVNLCIQGLRGHTAYLYDMTIAYSNTGEECTGKTDNVTRRPAPSMPEFLQGYSPQIHVHINRIPMDDIPKDEQGCRLWLHKVFTEKDSMLTDFYSSDPTKRGRLQGKGESTRLSLLSTLPALAFSCVLVAPFLSTSVGRRIYWRLFLVASITSIMWMKLTT